jgi:outer membrane immunogenic protein
MQVEKVMKKSTYLLGAAVIVLTGGTAGAADMAVKSAHVAPIVAPAFSWTGCYLGVHAGGGATRSDFTEQFFNPSSNSNTRGWGNGGLAGGQIGCNYQTGVLVLGVEGEGYWSDMKANREFRFSDIGTSDVEGVTARNKWDYTVAGRVGVAYERAFIYGKAGWAWGRFDFNQFVNDSPFFTAATSGSATLNGPLFGLGVEYALTNNWTVKGEYNYINYGLSPVDFTSSRCTPGCSTSNFTNSQSAEKHIFKFGVNYLFNLGGGPVVARY